MNSRALIAIDWGTSSLRAARLAPSGQPLEQREFARGILSVESGGFAALFDSLFGDWMQDADALCLMSGMVGSQQGWLQAPYCACPAGFDELADQLAWVAPGRIAIVPGLSVEHSSVPDVMRGEETQVFGALQLLGLAGAQLVLPGTHSKWVSVSGQRITNFSTWMTGEFYALLRQHSILARTMSATDDAFDGAAFDQGVTLALGGSSLLHSAFSTRTLALFDRLPAAAQPSYLSGLVIGEELRCQRLLPGAELVIIGSDLLTQRYQRALVQLDIRSRTVGSEASWAGLSAIARTLALT